MRISFQPLISSKSCSIVRFVGAISKGCVSNSQKNARFTLIIRNLKTKPSLRRRIMTLIKSSDTCQPIICITYRVVIVVVLVELLKSYST